MPQRHAYCILAHADLYCLETLLQLIDDPRNDVYILFDSKAPADLGKDLKCRYSQLVVIPPESRVDVRWGDISLSRAELTLLEEAVRSGRNYSYIHLLSGADLPLRSQDEIHDFFRRQPQGSNFIEIADGPGNEENLSSKTDYYYLFTRHQRQVRKGLAGKAVLLTAKILRQLFLRAQKLVGYKRDWGELKLARGINWATLSEDFVRYLVDRKEEILKMFKGVNISDEIYKQTMIINSPFNDTVKAFSRGNSDGIRLIDWERGNGKGSPKTWTMADWPELEEAFELFARKFSSAEDREVIDRIKQMVCQRGEQFKNEIRL